MAAKIFLDSDFEERFKIIGKVRKVLVVIYTERGDRNKIISARQADKNDEADYYEQFYPKSGEKPLALAMGM